MSTRRYFETTLPYNVEAILAEKYGGVWRVSVTDSHFQPTSIVSITCVHGSQAPASAASVSAGWSSVQFSLDWNSLRSEAELVALFLAKAAEIARVDQSKGKAKPAPMSLTARALTERPQWRWAGAAGMGVVLEEGGRTITSRVGDVNDSGDALREAGWLPDLTDWATIGILLGWCQRVRKTSLTAPLVDIWTAEAGGCQESAQSPGLAVAILLLTLWDREEGK